MGFFSKLFEKKECAICGGEIGLLGNRKLEDGNMCKDCAAKLSEWFSDRRNSTVQEITEQLAYREENQNKLSAFCPTDTVGEYYKVYVEEKNGVPTRFIVTRAADYIEDNADIIEFKDVSSFDTDIREHREELKRRNENNEYVSYNPPRYRYQYDFYVQINIINSPYIDEMKFKLNRDSVDIEGERFGRRSVSGIGQFIMTGNEFDPSFDPEYRGYVRMCDYLEDIFNAGRKGAAAVRTAPAEAAAEEVKRPKFCPECGAPAGTAKFCANCGSKL